MARQQYTSEEKVRLVLETIRGGRTIHEIGSKYNIHSNMLSKGKRDAESYLYTLFRDNSVEKCKVWKEQEAENNNLYAQIGRFTTQNERLTKSALITNCSRKIDHIHINHKAVLCHVQEMAI